MKKWIQLGVFVRGNRIIYGWDQNMKLGSNTQQLAAFLALFSLQVQYFRLDICGFDDECND
jgi:hypothetical protein